MTVRVTIDGETYSCGRSYFLYQHSGDPGEFRQFTPDRVLAALRDYGVTASDVDGGDVTVFCDGRIVSHAMGKFPSMEEGTFDSGMMGGGGGASIDILNQGYTANSSFQVRKMSESGAGGQPTYRTMVDGREVANGWERPFRIVWQRGSGGMGGGML